MNFLIILAYLLTLGVGWRMLGYSIKPALALAVIWTGVILASLILVPGYNFSPRASMFLLLMIVLTLIGSVAVEQRGGGSQTVDEARIPRYELTKYSTYWILAGTASGMISSLIVMYTSGYGIAYFFDLDLYLKMANAMTRERYIYGYTMPITARILMAPAHCAVMIAAVRTAAQVNVNRKQSMLSVLPFIPALLIAAILTTRASVLFDIVLYFSSFLSAWVYYHPARIGTTLSRRTVVRGIVGLSATAAMFIALQFARIGEIDVGRVGEVVMHLRKWPLGTVAGFTSWFDAHQFGGETLNYGYFTFMGLFALSGLRSRVLGVHDDFVDLGGGEFSNIFSVYRGLIMDYGVIGCCVVMLALGVIGAIAFRRARAGSAYAVGVLLCVYTFIVWSPIVSIWAYTSQITAVAMFFVYLRLETVRYGRVFA